MHFTSMSFSNHNCMEPAPRRNRSHESSLTRPNHLLHQSLVNQITDWSVGPLVYHICENTSELSKHEIYCGKRGATLIARKLSKASRIQGYEISGLDRYGLIKVTIGWIKVLLMTGFRENLNGNCWCETDAPSHRENLPWYRDPAGSKIIICH